MPSVVGRLAQQELIQPPKWLPANVHYEVVMGSVAYGVSTDMSDVDVYGWVMPPKEVVFPHLSGHIPGFDQPKEKFEQYQQHHIADPGSQREYDLSMYSIVKYFRLCADNNPNMIDSLFVPRRCVLFTSEIGEMVRDRRREFLHKGSFHKYKGYAYSQLHKINTKGVANVEDTRRFEKDHDIPHNTTMAEIEEEMRNRGL